MPPEGLSILGQSPHCGSLHKALSLPWSDWSSHFLHLLPSMHSKVLRASAHL